MAYLFSFLAILVPLVVFHELGHFIMAKLGGIKVTKFAFGFGKKLFGFRYRGTEYRWNLIPLGGYVDFMGEAIYTNEIPDDVKHFYNRPKWIRFLVLVMGPLFNLILAFVIFWGFFWIKTYPVPVHHGTPYTVGFILPDSPEATAGLQVGDRITAYNGEAIETVADLEDFLLFNPGKEVVYDVVRQNQQLTITYQIPESKHGIGERSFWPRQRFMIEEVFESFPAIKAGFQPLDVITLINGKEVFPSFSKENVISATLAETAPGPAIVTVERNGKAMDLEVVPTKNEEDKWIIGIRVAPEAKMTDLGFTAAMGMAWVSFKDNSTKIYTGLRKLIIGDLSIKTLSGPVEVGKFAKETLDLSFSQFLLLMGILSLNLGLLNLLPIPVLDGGEIFVLLVEAVSRKDFNLATKMKIKIVGFFFLIGLMGVVMVNDVLKIYQGA